MEIIFVTSNKNKVKEVKELVNSEAKGIVIEHLEYDYPELQFEELELIVEHATVYIRERIRLEKPFFIEDSGLFIHALNGFPGPFSSYVFKKIGNEGILKLMKDIKKEERRATFKSVIAFCEPSEPSVQSKASEPLKSASLLFVGVAEGIISEERRENGGFGYDPIFEFEGKTFAEISVEAKNKVSHRGRAFRELLRFLRDRICREDKL